jgi:hypothetical protein
MVSSHSSERSAMKTLYTSLSSPVFGLVNSGYQVLASLSSNPGNCQALGWKGVYCLCILLRFLNTKLEKKVRLPFTSLLSGIIECKVIFHVFCFRRENEPSP